MLSVWFHEIQISVTSGTNLYVPVCPFTRGTFSRPTHLLLVQWENDAVIPQLFSCGGGSYYDAVSISDYISSYIITLVSCSAYFLNLKMEAICSSETSVDFQRATRNYIPEDSTLQMVRWFVNDELERIWKKTLVFQWKYNPTIYVEALR
jgi:hypothetical protein